MIASAVISDRASPANVWRTLWITERSATMAPTPIAMQMKKNSSRFHDARISRTAMTSDEPHGARRLAAAVGRRLAHRTAVAQHQPLVGDRRDARIVRHQHQRHAARAPHLQQQVEDVPAVRAVEVAGRLVGEDQRRIVGQRPRDGDALLLAAGQLRRIVMPAIVQADFVEQRLRARGRVAAAGDLHRHLDVLDRGQRRHEVEELEDEADLLAAQPRERVFVERW